MIVYAMKESRRFIFLALLTAIIFTGCGGLNRPKLSPEPTELPEAWINRPKDILPASELNTSDLAVWWRQLGDPVLNELVKRTIAGSIDLESARARVKEARSLRGQAKSELGPSISTSLSAGRSEPLEDTSLSSKSFSGSLDMVWEADLFGAKRLSLEATQSDLKAAIEESRAVQVSIIADTVVAYTDLRVAEERIRVLDKSLLSQEETTMLTLWREQAGLASRLEVTQAQSNLGLTQAELPLYKQIADEARLRLNFLAGEVPGALDDLLTTKKSSNLLPIPPDTVATGIPAEVLRQRPDVRSAERQLEASWARLGVAEAGRYPTLQLTGYLDTQSAEFGELFNLDSVIANIVAGLTAPIFDSGRIRENIAIKEAQLEQAALNYRSIVIQALSEVELALSSFRLSQNRIQALEEAVREAGEAAELAEQRYAAGLVDLLSVLDTQRTLFSIEDQLAMTKGEYLNAFSTLYRALGGGWASKATGASDA